MNTTLHTRSTKLVQLLTTMPQEPFHTPLVSHDPYADVGEVFAEETRAVNTWDAQVRLVRVRPRARMLMR